LQLYEEKRNSGQLKGAAKKTARKDLNRKIRDVKEKIAQLKAMNDENEDSNQQEGASSANRAPLNGDEWDNDPYHEGDKVLLSVLSELMAEDPPSNSSESRGTDRESRETAEEDEEDDDEEEDGEDGDDEDDDDYDDDYDDDKRYFEEDDDEDAAAARDAFFRNIAQKSLDEVNERLSTAEDSQHNGNKSSSQKARRQGASHDEMPGASVERPPESVPARAPESSGKVPFVPDDELKEEDDAKRLPEDIEKQEARAKKLYSRRAWVQAAEAYDYTASLCSRGAEPGQEALRVDAEYLAKLHGNCAAALLMAGRLKECDLRCKKALKHLKANDFGTGLQMCKLRNRQGRAHLRLGNRDSAKKYFDWVLAKVKSLTVPKGYKVKSGFFDKGKKAAAATSAEPSLTPQQLDSLNKCSAQATEGLDDLADIAGIRRLMLSFASKGDLRIREEGGEGAADADDDDDEHFEDHGDDDDLWEEVSECSDEEIDEEERSLANDMRWNLRRAERRAETLQEYMPLSMDSLNSRLLILASLELWHDFRRACRRFYLESKKNSKRMSEPSAEAEATTAQQARTGGFRSGFFNREPQRAADDDEEDLHLTCGEYLKRIVSVFTKAKHWKLAVLFVKAVRRDDDSWDGTLVSDRSTDAKTAHNVNPEDVAEELLLHLINECDGAEAAARSKNAGAKDGKEAQETGRWASNELQQIRRMRNRKRQADEQYRSKNVDIAFRMYTQSLRVDADVLTPRERATLYNNRAACRMAQQRYEEAIRDCTESRRACKSFKKPYLRRARGYVQQQRYRSAISDYENYLAHSSFLAMTESYKVRQELEAAKRLQRERVERERAERRRKRREEEQRQRRRQQEYQERFHRSHSYNYGQQQAAPSEQDHYKVLGVSKQATQAQIKKAYHKLALKYHPDKNKAAGAAETFKKVNDAYQVVGDKEQRQQYDLQREFGGMGGAFGGYGFGQGHGHGHGFHGARQHSWGGGRSDFSDFGFF